MLNSKPRLLSRSFVSTFGISILIILVASSITSPIVFGSSDSATVKATILFSGIIFSNSQPSLGANYTISTNGTFYFMINMATGKTDLPSNNASAVFNAATSNLTHGGKIFVQRGLYTLTNRIIIWSNNITLTGEGSSTELQLSDNTLTDVILVLNRIGTVIENLKINGNKAHMTDTADWGIQHGINFSSANYSRVSNVWVEECEHTGINTYLGHDLIVENSVSINNGAHQPTSGSGIDIDGTSNLTVTNNTSTGNFVNGIWVNALSNATIKNNYCSSNTGSTSSAGANGIFFHVVSNSSVTQNIAYQNGNNGIFVTEGSSNITISNNTALFNVNRGFGAFGSNFITFLNNSAKENGLEGIFVQSGSNYSITENNLENNGGYAGIYLYSSSKATSDGNTIYCEKSSGIIIDNSTFSVICNNEVLNSLLTGVDVQYSSNITISNNLVNSTQQDGIRLHDESNFNVIDSNILDNNGGCAINCQAWGICNYNQVKNNVIYAISGIDIAHAITNIPTTTVVSNNLLITKGN